MFKINKISYLVTKLDLRKKERKRKLVHWKWIEKIMDKNNKILISEKKTPQHN